MADERLAHAGDLNSDMLGKRVKYWLKTNPPTERVTTVTEVRHRKNVKGEKSTFIKGERDGNPTTVRLPELAIVEVLA